MSNYIKMIGVFGLGVITGITIHNLMMKSKKSNQSKEEESSSATGMVEHYTRPLWSVG